MSDITESDIRAALESATESAEAYLAAREAMLAQVVAELETKAAAMDTLIRAFETVDCETLETYGIKASRTQPDPPGGIVTESVMPKMGFRFACPRRVYTRAVPTGAQ